ncbi:MAG: DNA translocase FtsK 4TM domain-containing protein, partial [Nitratireductor sp.]|nr:DNA translocase FtsK 4TM domain-containing protein [Nitratireductor sp.]
MRSAGAASRASIGHEFSALPQSYSSRFSGQLGVLAGLALLAAVAIAFASLATWSVDDPSLSHANGRDIANAGGYWGAVFADLTLQILGLAAIMLVVPPAVWGWFKVMQRSIGSLRRRLAFWPLGVLTVATALSCLQRPESWPLPSGLGGLAGDVVLKLPSLALGGYPSGFIAGVLFLLLIVPGALIMLFSAGLIARAPQAGRDRVVIDPDTGEVFEDDDGEGGGWIAGALLGAITHFWLMAGALVRRLTGRKSRSGRLERPAGKGYEPEFSDDFADEDAAPRRASMLARGRDLWGRLTAPEDDGLEALHRDMRDEPGFSPPAGGRAPDHVDDGYIHAPQDAPGYGETVYGPGAEHDAIDAAIEAEWGERSAPQAAHQPLAPAGRVAPMQAGPKPGSRVVREAQQSMLADDFELPHLSFLSEPKNLVQDATLSTEALEANARLLEGVLEDFGVKGEIINVRPGPVVTLYELEPAPGIKSSRVIGLADDIARSMSAIACRVA